MFHPKRVFLVSFAVASLLCGSALANTAPVAPDPSPSPSPSDSPCFDFECKFEGGGGDKNGGWSQKCHAEGWFSTDQTVSPFSMTTEMASSKSSAKMATTTRTSNRSMTTVCASSSTTTTAL